MAHKDELKGLRKAAEAQGWTVRITNGGHLRWDSPKGGKPIFTASTPSDRRALANIRSMLRAAGLDLPRK